MKNMLILSAGRRNSLIGNFKKAFENAGKIVATDNDLYSPAIHDADAYYIVPRINEPGYIDIILDICKKEKIDGICTLIDPEISLLAENADKFKKIGVIIFGSDYDVVMRCYNKYEMYKWLSQNGYKCAVTHDNVSDFLEDEEKGKIKYPLFVKPTCGSASINIDKATDRETAIQLFERHDDMIIQEFLNGQEIGADCYVDMISGKLISIFTKKKLKMRAGETDKSVSFCDPVLFDLIQKFVSESHFRGPVDIDLFSCDGEYYISEVNPRFGGGYPHAYACGIDIQKMMLNNLNGLENSPSIGKYRENVYMMKYSVEKIIEE